MWETFKREMGRLAFCCRIAIVWWPAHQETYIWLSSILAHIFATRSFSTFCMLRILNHRTHLTWFCPCLPRTIIFNSTRRKGKVKNYVGAKLCNHRPFRGKTSHTAWFEHILRGDAWPVLLNPGQHRCRIVGSSGHRNQISPCVATSSRSTSFRSEKMDQFW